MNNSVTKPSHYTDGKIEVMDFIQDKNLNFCRGNAVKYISRAGKKDPKKEIEDLQKAVYTLQREISRLEALKASENASVNGNARDYLGITTPADGVGPVS